MKCLHQRLLLARRLIGAHIDGCGRTCCASAAAEARSTGCLQIAIGRASRPSPRSKRSRPWDRLPARYLPARLQQPSPKLGMELSPHHSNPEVTVGVVPAPAHHVRFLRTLYSSCLPSPCLRLSRDPWSGITPTSTMQAP